MTATALENAGLRRMLKPAKAETLGAQMSEARAWRSSLPRVTEKAIGTVATVVGYTVKRTDLESILDGWDEFALSMLLGGSDEARGLVQLDVQLRTGLVEAQTLGKVYDTVPVPREATPIDAALCDHIAEKWMAGAAGAGGWTLDWVPKRIIKDARSAKVALWDGDYIATDVAISLRDGARTGLMRILVPLALTETEAETPGPGGKHAGFLALEAEIEAVLYRTEMPLKWLHDLAPGSVLEVPAGAIDRVRIETLEGKGITRARLGRLGEMRAVRILAKDAPDTPARVPNGRDPDMFSDVGPMPADSVQLPDLAELPPIEDG